LKETTAVPDGQVGVGVAHIGHGTIIRATRRATSTLFHMAVPAFYATYRIGTVTIFETDLLEAVDVSRVNRGVGL